jgi:hypothetical protein
MQFKLITEYYEKKWKHGYLKENIKIHCIIAAVYSVIRGVLFLTAWKVTILKNISRLQV